MTTVDSIQRSISEAKAMKRELVHQGSALVLTMKSHMLHTQEDREIRARFNAIQDSIDEVNDSILNMTDELSELTRG